MKIAFLSLAILFSVAAHATPNKILVVLSGENKITLKAGAVHSTGFFLSELVVPLKGLIEAGYEPVFATPQGNKPFMDKVSDSAFWFSGDEQKYFITAQNPMSDVEFTKTLLRALSEGK